MGSKSWLNTVRAALRDELERHGIPSDRVPHWIREHGGQWRPYTEDDQSLRSVPGVAHAIWYSRMKELTEELSIERQSGELLFNLTSLLRQAGIDKHLWCIAAVLRDYSGYRIAGHINFLAHQGAQALRGRALGPKAKKERSKQISQIAIRLALEYWTQHPLYRNDASNTAACIADAVNGELQSRRLLPPKRAGLSHKSIAEYIRLGFRVIA